MKFNGGRLILQVREIFNFTQDDMMTEDIFILDCHSCVFIWVGQNVDTKIRAQALSIREVRYNFMVLCVEKANFLFFSLCWIHKTYFSARNF